MKTPILEFFKIKKPIFLLLAFLLLKFFNKILAHFCILNHALTIVIFYFQYIIKTKNNKSFVLPKLSKKFNLGKLILE